MKPVERSEILDHVTYGEQRGILRPLALRAKAKRRIELCEGTFTFLFENRDTVRYQVQEMTRVEKLVKEADIQHELDTYNELLGGEAEIGCTLLIGIDDEAERTQKLVDWLELPQHTYVELGDGTRVRATFDPRQVGEDRLSSVQYFKFAVAEAPVAVGVDLPGLDGARVELDTAQREALAEDLAE